MRRTVLVPLALAASLTALPDRASTTSFPPDTVVAVEGNARDGFGIHHLDGSSTFPPTRSESVAECEEYNLRVAVVRCKTRMRVWYRDLAVLQTALRYVELGDGAP